MSFVDFADFQNVQQFDLLIFPDCNTLCVAFYDGSDGQYCITVSDNSMSILFVLDTKLGDREILYLKIYLLSFLMPESILNS